jgi:hypothetical protein
MMTAILRRRGKGGRKSGEGEREGGGEYNVWRTACRRL